MYTLTATIDYLGGLNTESTNSQSDNASTLVLNVFKQVCSCIRA